MTAVCRGKIRRKPRQAIAARVQTVGPQVRPLREPWRGGVVIEISHERVDSLSVLLRDLCADDSLDGKARLVRVGLGVERTRRVARVDPAGEVDLLDVRVRIFSDRAMPPICCASMLASAFALGREMLGCACATFTHATATCDSLNPSGASS